MKLLRLLSIVIFLVLASLPAFATSITVSSTTFTSWTFGGTTASIKVYSNRTFVTSDAQTIIGGTSQGFYRTIACTVAATVVSCPSFSIDSTTDSSIPTVVYIADLYDSNNRNRRRILNGFRVPTTLGTTVTWEQLRLYNLTISASLPSTYYTADQVNLAITAAIAGIPPSSGATFTKKLRRDYASLALAETAAAANELNFDVEEEVDANSTIEANVFTSVDSQGIFDIDSGMSLTIENLRDPGDRKLNKGPGKLIIKNTPYLRMSYWTGPLGQPTTAAEAIDISETDIDVTNAAVHGPAPYVVAFDNEKMLVTSVAGNTLTVQRAYDSSGAATHINGAISRQAITSVMWAGITDSLTAMGGGVLIIPPGDWATAGGINLPNGTTVKGSGGIPDAIGGTNLILVANNTYIFRIGETKRNIKIEDIALDVTGTTGSESVSIAGTGSTGTFHPRFSYVSFKGGDYNVRLRDTASNGWLLIGLVFDHCYFLNASVASFASYLTPNTSVTFISPSFTPLANGTSYGIDLNYSGPLKLLSPTFNGVNITPRAVRSTISTIDTTGGATHDLITTTASHGMTVGGTLEPITILNGTPANLPGGYADLTLLYFKAVSSTTGYAYRKPKDAFIGGEAALRFDFTSVGTGTNVIRTTVPVMTGVPKAALHVQNTSSGISIDNWQDEGFPYSILVENTYESRRAIHIFGGSTFQGLLQFNSQALVVSEGNYYPARSFKDYSSSIDTSAAKIYSRGDSVYNVGTYQDIDATVQSSSEPTINGFVGNSVFFNYNKPDTATNESNVPGITTLNHPLGLDSRPIQEYVRDKNGGLQLPLVRQGLKEGYESRASLFYDDYLLDDLPAPTYSWMKGWFEKRPDPTTAAARQGHYLNGHLAVRGREANVLQTELTSSANVTTLNAALSKYYYFSALGENTTIDISAVAGQGIVASEEKVIFIPATTSFSRIVVWGNGFLKYGRGTFETGLLEGTWVFRFVTLGGSLYQTGPPMLITPSGGGPEIAFKWRGTSGTSQQMAVNEGYLANNGALVTYTLPLGANVGEVIAVKGMNAGGWRIAQNASQQIIWKQGGVDGTDETTIGTGGRLDSTDGYDAIHLICIIQNTTWAVVSSKGTISLT